MRGNLRQILSVPEEERTEPQRKAIIKITGTLNQARQEELEKGKKMALRIQQLKQETLSFENAAFVQMVLGALAYHADEHGHVPGIIIKPLADNNPFMSSAAFDQLESLGYLQRFSGGSLLILERGMALINKSRRRHSN